MLYKSFVYSKESEQIIDSHEKKMKLLYRKKIEQYKEQFSKIGCELEFGFQKYNLNGKSSDRSKNGYVSSVSCGIYKDGEVICTDEEEYFTLIWSWGICSVSREWFRKEVCLWDESEDIERDIAELYAGALEYLKKQ